MSIRPRTSTSSLPRDRPNIEADVMAMAVDPLRRRAYGTASMITTLAHTAGRKAASGPGTSSEPLHCYN